MKTNTTSITPKQLEILLLLYRFRFLNRIQIQKLLNHKNANRINPWLKDLTEKELIGRIYSKRIGENIKPAIYYLAVKSRHILKDQKECIEPMLKHVYREQSRLATFRSHCMLVADTYFYFQALIKGEQKTLDFQTKVEYANQDFLLKPLPDAFIAIKAPRKKTKRYFLEIFDEGVPRFAIRYRIKQYIEYFDDDDWQNNTNYPNPKILLICPNELTQRFIQRFINKALEDACALEPVFLVTSKDKLALKTEDIWLQVETE